MKNTKSKNNQKSSKKTDKVDWTPLYQNFYNLVQSSNNSGVSLQRYREDFGNNSI